MDTTKLNYLQRLKTRLTTAKHGQKTALVAEAAAFLCVSKQQVYRELEAAGLTPTKRKTRKDKGNCMIDEEQAKLIGGMILVATRANGKRILSVADATQILIDDGKLPQVSPATMLRALRKYHCHPDQLATPSAHMPQKSLHPNHVWQIDASVCVLFYLPKGGLQVMEAKEFYKNKPKNLKRIENERVIRYVVSDHYSGALYVEYVTGAEDSANLTQVFLNAIQKRDANDPMHGVPNILVLDKGSANMSGYFLNLLERLNVKPIPHAAGNSRAKGQVEKSNDIVECKFESRLAFIETHSLDELNQLCVKWRTHFNATAIHTRHGNSRNKLWLSISREQLRLAPSLEVCQELVTTMPKDYQVRGDLTVTHSIKGHGNLTYKVDHLAGIYVKAQVQIVVNAYRLPDIDVVWQDKTYTVSPAVLNAAGFYEAAATVGEQIKQQTDSPIDKRKKQLLQAAYGVDTDAAVDKARKNKQAAYQGVINPLADVDKTHATGQVPDVLTRAGTVLDMPTQRRELAPLSHVEAAKAIKGCVGELWTAKHYSELTAQYPNQVPAEAIDSIVARIKGGQSINHLKVVNG